LAASNRKGAQGAAYIFLRLNDLIVFGLPKVSSSYPLSPGGGRGLVRGDKKRLLTRAISWL
jgi:hypothetical protein